MLINLYTASLLKSFNAKDKHTIKSLNNWYLGKSSNKKAYIDTFKQIKVLVGIEENKK